MSVLSTTARRAGRGRGRSRATTAGRFALLLVIAVIMAFPLFWMALTAVSPERDLAGPDLRFWPSSLELGNFSRAWNALPFSTWFVNSVAIAVVAVVLTVSINLVAGFVLAKMRFTGRNVVLLVIVSTLMIPVQVVMVPQFRIVAELGWVNSYWAVIIPRAAEAFGIFLARQFMLAIPDELIDAAKVDGAGTLRILRSVILPLCKPLIAVLVIFTFMYRWNEFAWPLIVLKDQDLYTLPIGLTFLQGQYTTDYSGLMAMALVSALPMLVVFLVFQRYLVQGIATTGLK
ncbi:carbohydrate ABC transporter permease [Motilibacter deserti]|uniref:Carbohydrate ABC transporter permease n=1 Tax=Motilibacter deserti TaxID=2714956 RepID=A0ABX0GX91_9ACTN|nr:carbohydrate ABC transporter permease [Motilibacter deserti]NHC15597.1 carbohydrate ABC transporter permease [Motilibacter deserti]